MNKVDLHVKRLMLRAPTIFPSRWSVLQHIFLHIGTGYGWTGKGVMASIYDRDQTMPESMDMSDLDEPPMRGHDRPEMAQFVAVDRVRLGQKKLLREYIAANIDVYASSLELGDATVAYSILPSSLAHSPLGQVPKEGPLDREWALAADAVATKLLGELSRRLDKNNIHEVSPTQQKQFAALQVELRQSVDALERATKLRAGRENVLKALQGFMRKTETA